MAIASTKTKLPLATWAKIMGIHPAHFEQVRIGSANPHCSEIMFQYSWQNSDHISREEIAIAIAEAEAKIEHYLGFRLKPSWEVDEWRPAAKPFTSELVIFGGGDVRGYKQTVAADWKHFISGGIQSKELIDDEAAIAWSDADNDGYFEIATVTVATSVVDKNEIAVFYPGEAGDDAWEIRPTKVVIASGVATITFRRELAVKPEFFETIILDDLGSADGLDDDDFLETVDVYRRYNDPQTQASFLWEPLASTCGICDGSGCASCAYTTQSGCLIVRGNPRNSIVGYSPGTWDSDEDVFTADPWTISRLPDIVRLYYYAGLRNKSQAYISRMDPEWERAVAYMACAMLDRPACDCNADTWNKWREDFALFSGDEDGKPIYRTPSGADREFDILNNPFGTRRGEIYAWNKVRTHAVYESVNLHV